MALAMSHPFKHPKTGIFWLRKRVPDNLRQLVGKREELQSLKTKDPDEAKRLFPQALAELESRWASLRKGPRSLTEREAHEIATVIYDGLVEKYADNPSDNRNWRIELYERLWPDSPLVELRTRTNDDGSLGHFEILDPKAYQNQKHFDAAAARIQWECLVEAEQLLTARGLVVDASGKLRLAKAIAAAKQRAALDLRDLAKGSFSRSANRSAFANHPAPSAAGKAALPLKTLIDGWAAEKRPAEKTLYEWRRVVEQLKVHLGHDDAQRITAEDLIGWKGKMVEAGRRAKTIRDAQLAPVRAILRWGVDNGMLSSNPGERVTIEVRVRPGEGRRSFDDAEATLILTQAIKAKDPVLRWVPWLCAYSGARVAEVCQLRREDIVQIGQLWCMKFDPAAGSLKTLSSERMVPIHAAVLRSGFLAFTSRVPSGPLFAGLPPDIFGSRGGNGTKVLGRWVRSLGLSDPRLAPNHSWRHRLKTSARRYGLAPDIVDAITGHARKSVGDNYGEFPMEALARELAKLPDLIEASNQTT